MCHLLHLPQVQLTAVSQLPNMAGSSVKPAQAHLIARVSNRASRSLRHMGQLPPAGGWRFVLVPCSQTALMEGMLAARHIGSM